MSLKYGSQSNIELNTESKQRKWSFWGGLLIFPQSCNLLLKNKNNKPLNENWFFLFWTLSYNIFRITARHFSLGTFWSGKHLALYSRIEYQLVSVLFISRMSTMMRMHDKRGSQALHNAWREGQTLLRDTHQRTRDEGQSHLSLSKRQIPFFWLTFKPRSWFEQGLLQGAVQMKVESFVLCDVVPYSRQQHQVVKSLGHSFFQVGGEDSITKA